MGTPFFSIIIATYNVEGTLPNALTSIGEQEFRDFEVLIADGGSTDKTADIIEGFAQVCNVAWTASARDSGIYDAWNKALVHRSGIWTIFLGADDSLFDSQVLMRAHRALKNVDAKAFPVAYGCVQVVTAQGLPIRVDGAPWQKIEKKFLHMNCLHHQGVFHHFSLFSDGLFRSDFRSAGDFELLLRALKSKSAVFLSELKVSRAAVGGISTRPESAVWIADEFLRARSLNGIRGFSWQLFLLKNYGRLKLCASSLLPRPLFRRLTECRWRVSKTGAQPESNS